MLWKGFIGGITYVCGLYLILFIGYLHFMGIIPVAIVLSFLIAKLMTDSQFERLIKKWLITIIVAAIILVVLWENPLWDIATNPIVFGFSLYNSMLSTIIVLALYTFTMFVCQSIMTMILYNKKT